MITYLLIGLNTCLLITLVAMISQTHSLFKKLLYALDKIHTEQHTENNNLNTIYNSMDKLVKLNSECIITMDNLEKKLSEQQPTQKKK